MGANGGSTINSKDGNKLRDSHDALNTTTVGREMMERLVVVTGFMSGDTGHWTVQTVCHCGGDNDRQTVYTQQTR